MRLLIYVAPASHVDDEYARAGITDPKIFITTSRDPSSRLTQFSKVIFDKHVEQALTLPRR